ncbi:hypothetical protein F3Y22_tig00009009pilonHSYRG00094 [Hibiscus syriacus]|uniref:Uncharacterized protein n=1 Tax=Hibiscus syriacus TaxID=106335 RepID=A0A6A3C769_HIBSY|nr:hypothetical protein F3Y22_tig00009009pilonHSYRG00094 [Hibiscus syriacus]
MNPQLYINRVEFDTVQDFEFRDLDDSQIGIDINSLHSNASVSVSYYTQGGSTKQNLTLKSGKLIQAWIDYDSIENVMNVTIAPTSKRPSPLYSFHVDFSPFLHEFMYVGFSASTGHFVIIKIKNTEVVEDWELEIDEAVSVEFTMEHSEIQTFKLLSSEFPMNQSKLLGWCWRRGDLLLVYHFMANGSLGTSRIVGTMGYIALELPKTGKATTSSDVYAFGALLLEEEYADGGDIFFDRSKVEDDGSEETTVDAGHLSFMISTQISNKMLNLNVNAVSKMKNLRLLKVLCLSNCDELKYLPNELRLLDWMGYPLRFLPPSFQPDNLVALLLPYSRIEQLWRGNIQPLYKLKVLNLKGSDNLIKTPDFTTAPNLEILILEGCTRIVDVHPSVGVLSRLKLLNLRSCTSLRNLPTKIGIESLETLILKDCRNLISLPRSIASRVVGRARLKLKGPSSKIAPNLASLFQLFQRIESVPLMLHSLSGLRSLRELKLRNCNLHDGDIPSDISCLSSLEKLDLGGNSFISIPVIGSELSRLQYLGLSNCRELKSFPKPGASRELFAAPSKVCNAPDWTQFSGLHCYRLVENINALTMLKFHLKRVPYLKKSSDGVIPGGEIPKWFSHQTVDSSIKIPLPNNIQNDSQWIGVVFCSIFVNDDASRDEELTCEAVIHHRNSRKDGSDGSVCRSRNPRRVTGCGWIFSEKYNQPIIKDHIYFCYFSREKLYPFSSEDKCGESETENSSSDWSNKEFDELQLSVKSDGCHPSVKVKKCGIRILYEKDLEDNNEDSAVSGSIANGPLVKRKRNVYEETEAGSQPKRMEKFFNFMTGRPGKNH